MQRAPLISVNMIHAYIHDSNNIATAAAAAAAAAITTIAKEGPYYNNYNDYYLYDNLGV